MEKVLELTVLFATLAQIERIDGALMCYPPGFNFTTYCKNTLGGIQNGARCFFIANQSTSWDAAWDVCASYGGTLAQIHTTNEYKAITVDWPNLFPQLYPVFIAAKHDTTIGRNDCYAGSTHTYWYSDAATYDPNFSGANTWIRKRNGDDCSYMDGYCLDFYVWSPTQILVGDWDCNNSTVTHTLCVVTYGGQSYSYDSSGCMSEVVLGTYTSSLQACADYCTQNAVWCRSFQYWCAQSKCDLFSWVPADTSTSKLNGCWMYTYDV